MTRNRRRRKRKCLHCAELFHPDPRTRDRQRHCSAPECKRASKAWRQRRWLSKPENREYFRGPQHTERVRQWRKSHPSYWRKTGPLDENALQDDCPTQDSHPEGVTSELSALALQDDCLLQLPLVVGLISNLTGFTLQDDIALHLRGLHARGNSILGAGPGIEPQGDPDDDQNAVVCATATEGARAVQLGGSAPGA